MVRAGINWEAFLESKEDDRSPNTLTKVCRLEAHEVPTARKRPQTGQTQRYLVVYSKKAEKSEPYFLP